MAKEIKKNHNSVWPPLRESQTIIQEISFRFGLNLIPQWTLTVLLVTI